MRECKDCCKLVLHQRTDRKNAHGTIHIDHSNRQWVGFTCPSCRYDNKRLDDKPAVKKTILDSLDSQMEDAIYV